METLTLEDVNNIQKQIAQRSDRCLGEIKRLVYHSEGHHINVEDTRCDRIHVIVDHYNGETKEEHVTDIICDDEMRLAFKLDTGETVSDIYISYTGDVWPQMLSTLIKDYHL